MPIALSADRAVPTMIIHEFVDSTSYDFCSVCCQHLEANTLSILFKQNFRYLLPLHDEVVEIRHEAFVRQIIVSEDLPESC